PAFARIRTRTRSRHHPLALTPALPPRPLPTRPTSLVNEPPDPPRQRLPPPVDQHPRVARRHAQGLGDLLERMPHALQLDRRPPRTRPLVGAWTAPRRRRRQSRRPHQAHCSVSLARSNGHRSGQPIRRCIIPARSSLQSTQRTGRRFLTTLVPLFFCSLTGTH